MNSITIEISESIKQHFNQLTTTYDDVLNRNDVNRSLLKISTLIANSQDTSLINHLKDLENMIHMISDSQWNISSGKVQRINAALSYFLNEDDIIPDNTPGLGYLDDCIVISNTKEFLAHELQDFNDFQATRRVYGKNKCKNREDWKKIKHQETSSRLRHRRTRFSMKNRMG